MRMWACLHRVDVCRFHMKQKTVKEEEDIFNLLVLFLCCFFY